MKKYRWRIQRQEELLTSHLSRSLGISRLLAKCLVNRGYVNEKSASLFLKPELKNLKDPFFLTDIEKAIERLFLALESEEPIIIFGDYDVDGVTSTAVLYDFLKKGGWNVNYYLPRRMEEGYGLSVDAVANCLKKFPVKLIVAVDCGTGAVEVINELKKNNIDVIVLDHHQPSTVLPPAVALVNPFARRSDSKDTAVERIPNYPAKFEMVSPFQELCSVGIVFKLVHGLTKRGRELGCSWAVKVDIREYLDFVALGTVADLAPLVGENRILVSAGLKKINKNPSCGIAALIEVSAAPKPIGVYEIGYMLAPRLNAAGRLETAEEAFELLVAETEEEALPIAQRLDKKNHERQRIEHEIAEEVLTSLLKRFNPDEDYVVVEGDPSWHIGVVGIVASRIVQQLYRPTIIFGGEGNFLRGSARSIEKFNIVSALEDCRDLLIRYGGHSMAAGVSIEYGKMDEFKKRLNSIAKTMLKTEDFVEEIDVDCEVGLDELTYRNVEELERLKPYGICNESVYFVSRNLRHSRPLLRIGSERQHVKMWVTDGKAMVEAVWWNGGKEATLPVGRFDLVFAPQINQYKENRCVQLRVVDWRQAE
ncbi:MAG: single-stranded-DNA-specific exonuclease RecJ [Verrucomicrobiae bacterium]|nr:single-stranded-DNA-specific exonuclease RecJ [Verrucomicrobiae bacterium]